MIQLIVFYVVLTRNTTSSAIQLLLLVFALWDVVGNPATTPFLFSSSTTAVPALATKTTGITTSTITNKNTDTDKLSSSETQSKMSSSSTANPTKVESVTCALCTTICLLTTRRRFGLCCPIWLKQILKVDERDQTLNVYLWLELYWVDQLLKWDPSLYGGLDRIHVPSAKIWRPDLLVYNNANMNVEDNEMETNAIIKYNGEVTLFRAMITDIACSLSLSLFHLISKFAT
uniref:Neurotransmitter-gated ion-channel ligand-binding domain-containing protein n=1 Tax=Ditylenchus dipsaci TaxID=166011 RepID=A0A915ECN0_9BILA